MENETAKSSNLALTKLERLVLATVLDAILTDLEQDGPIYRAGCEGLELDRGEHTALQRILNKL